MLARKSIRPHHAEPEVPHFYLWLDNQARQGTNTPLTITSPFDGKVVGMVSMAGRRHIREAISSSRKAFPMLKGMSRFQRSELLSRIVELLWESRTELVDAMVLEGGKPHMLAEQEFERTIATFGWAAEEVRRFAGEQIPLDGMSRGHGYEGYTRREPIGPILAITPFNFPLNLAAHKVAPALACGNPVILKPASNTPICAMILARIVTEAGFPPGSLNAMPMKHQDMSLLFESDDIKMVSFTGSPAVGWKLKQMAGKQRITLELGGNSGSYVDASADLGFAAKRLAAGGFAHAGQSCIAVQRIYAHKDIHDELQQLLLDATGRIKSGNPQQKDVLVGPMITPESAKRALSWIGDAVKGGARIECGGKMLAEGLGQVMAPTLLTNVKDSMRVCREEIFAPVITLSPVAGCEEAIQHINDSAYGLQAAIFSNDARNIQYAIANLETGGVVVNDVPTFRVDMMPYGGSKASGLGREGIRSAMMEMSEEKMVVTRLSE